MSKANYAKEFRQLLNQDASLTDFVMLLREIRDCNRILKSGGPDSPIHLAVLSNRLDVVELLVQNGAQLAPIEVYSKPPNPYPEFNVFEVEDEQNRFTGDPLFTAARYGYLKIFDFLAPLASVNQRRNAVLFLAEGILYRYNSSLEGSGDRNNGVEQDIQEHPGYSDADAFGSWLTNLMTASLPPRMSGAELLQSVSLEFRDDLQHAIEGGLSVDTVRDNGCTPLWTAACNGYVEVIEARLAAGASVDVPNQKDGWTPLMIAVDTHKSWVFGTEAKNVFGENHSRQLQVVELLLAAGANPRHQGNNGETALYLASDYEKSRGFEGETLDRAIQEMELILRNADTQG